MNSKRTIFSLILAILLVGIYVYFHRSAGASAKQNAIANIVTVAAASVQQKNVMPQTQVIGTVQPIATVSLKSMVDGQIVSVNFKEGDIVNQGELLINIDPRPFQVALAQADATLTKDQAQLANAASQYERGKKLLPDGYIAKQDFDTLRANVQTLKGTVKADQAVVADAKLQLSYCSIYAPISGKTGSLLIKPGNLVKANDTNALVVINQITPINVVFSLPEQQLPDILQELATGPVSVTAFTDQLNRYSATGKLTFVDNTVDSSTGTIQMKATFDNTKQQLWPGQYVNIKLPLMQINNAVLVPTIAIQAGPNGSYVFVINPDHTVRLQLVATGATVGDQTIISKGLHAGEQVVTEGQLRLTDGASVRIAAPSESA